MGPLLLLQLLTGHDPPPSSTGDCLNSDSREQQGKGHSGRKREKIFSVSPPAESVCGLGENVSDILGRSRGRAGSKRPRDCPSLEPCPPEAPHYRESLTPRRSIPETARRRDLGVLRPYFPRPPLQVSQAGKPARPLTRSPALPPRTPGSSAEMSQGRGRRELWGPFPPGVAKLLAGLTRRLPAPSWGQS